MLNSLETVPSNQPAQITKCEYDAIRFMFERRVIYPLFFGHGTDVTPAEAKRIQAAIDAADLLIGEFITDNYQVLNEL